MVILIIEIVFLNVTVFSTYTVKECGERGLPIAGRKRVKVCGRPQGMSSHVHDI